VEEVCRVVVAVAYRAAVAAELAWADYQIRISSVAAGEDPFSCPCRPEHAQAPASSKAKAGWATLRGLSS
jgi:hypothetical protein